MSKDDDKESKEQIIMKTKPG